MFEETEFKLNLRIAKRILFSLVKFLLFIVSLILIAIGLILGIFALYFDFTLLINLGGIIAVLIGIALFPFAIIVCPFYSFFVYGKEIALVYSLVCIVCMTIASSILKQITIGNHPPSQQT